MVLCCGVLGDARCAVVLQMVADHTGIAVDILITVEPHCMPVRYIANMPLQQSM
jgi:hypothetical protein